MIQITTSVAKLIHTFLNQRPGKMAKRRLILAAIGETDKTNCPFDQWAKKHLVNLGRQLGYGLMGHDYNLNLDKAAAKAPLKRNKRTTLTLEQELLIAKRLADIVFLRPEHDFTEAEAREAADGVGVEVPPHVKLTKVVQDRFKSAWTTLALELMDVKEVEVIRDKDIDTFSFMELLGALLRKAPQFAQVVAALYSTMPEVQQAAMPSITSLTRKRADAVHIMVTGLLSGQVGPFLARPKLAHLVQDGKLVLTVIKQDTVRVVTPTSVSQVVMWRMTRHSLYHKMIATYGNARVTMVDGLTRMEEEVIAAYVRYSA